MRMSDWSSDVCSSDFTEGQYAIAHPAVLGVEAAGVIEEIGPDIAGFRVGDRVAYCMVRGAYAQKRRVPASRLVKLPDFISDAQAAACMVKGITSYRSEEHRVGKECVSTCRYRW